MSTQNYSYIHIDKVWLILICMIKRVIKLTNPKSWSSFQTNVPGRVSRQTFLVEFQDKCRRDIQDARTPLTKYIYVRDDLVLNLLLIKKGFKIMCTCRSSETMINSLMKCQKWNARKMYEKNKQYQEKCLFYPGENL